MMIDGYKPIVAVTVLFSEAEYLRMREQRYFNAEGTVRSVVRGELGMQPFPIGFRKLNKDYTIVTTEQYDSLLAEEES